MLRKLISPYSMVTFVCHVKEGIGESERRAYRAGCSGLPFYADHEGKRYCVLHSPSEHKTGQFMKVLVNKLARNDYDFRGTVFPASASNFEKRLFDADVKFAGATFHGKAAFSGATFKKEADFSEATFKSEADFSEAEFEETGKEEAKQEALGKLTKLWKAREAAEKARKEKSRRAEDEANTQAARAEKELKEAQRKVRQKRDADFAKAVFEGEANFEKCDFEGEANFREATLDKEADFSEATFNGEARFRKATFKQNADFSEAKFKEEANFRRATFKGFVEFKAPSNEVPCKKHTFYKRANFSAAKFEERVAFVGRCTFDTEQKVTTFRNALIEKPENFSFDRVELRPSWFIDANVQRFRFTNVQWRKLRDRRGFAEEIEAIRYRRSVDPEVEELRYPRVVLARTCRELSANAEDNHDYLIANEFHYWAMEAVRKKGWSRAWLITTAYWAMSGYGVRAARAFLALAVICVAFAVLYMLLGPAELQYFRTALVYSLGAMARLNPNPRPDPATDPGLFQLLVIAEGILGPLQIGLLLLAIRRKVMR